MTYTFKSGNASIYAQLFKTVIDAAETVSDVDGLLVDFFMQPLPVTNGTNSLGLSPNVTDRVVVDINFGYDNAADDDTIAAALQGLFNQQKQIVVDAGLFVNFTYLNYAGANQDPIKTYGDLATLQAVSKKYDPAGFFQTAVPGPWKLFK